MGNGTEESENTRKDEMVILLERGPSVTRRLHPGFYSLSTLSGLGVGVVSRPDDIDWSVGHPFFIYKTMTFGDS